jgi:hypothetical protein
LLATLSRHHDGAGQDERRRALMTEAIALARRCGPATLSVVLSQAPVAFAAPEDAEQRLASATEGIAVASSVEQREVYAFAHGHRLLALLELGHGADADRCLEAYCVVADELRIPFFIWHVHVVTAMRAVLRGDFEEGRRAAGQAWELERRHDAESVEPKLFHDVMVALARGRRADCEAAAAVAAECVDRHPTRPIWRATSAALQAALDEEAAAGAILDEHLASAHGLRRDEEYLTTLVMFAEASARLQRADVAEAVYPLLAPFAGRNPVAERGAACWGSVSRHLGLLAATCGREAEAERHFEAALGENLRLGALPWAARTGMAYADALLRGPATEHARALALEQEAQTLADATGIDLRRPVLGRER